MDYDATRTALLHPEVAASRLLTEAPPDDVALACEAARLAYCRWDERSAEAARIESALARCDFGSFGYFQHPGTDGQGFAACRDRDGLVLVAFRGTQPDKLGDLLTDADVRMKPWRLGADGADAPMGSVHVGFANTALGLWEDLHPWLREVQGRRRSLVVCGHSLGAANATLLAVAARADVLLTLGSPRVGDPAFCAAVERSVGTILRHVDCCDVVSTLPPELGGRFRHVGEQRYIDRHGALRPGLSADEVDDDRREARSDYLARYTFRTGTVLVRDLADHAPHNYLRSLWP